MHSHRSNLTRRPSCSLLQTCACESQEVLHSDQSNQMRGAEEAQRIDTPAPGTFFSVRAINVYLGHVGSLGARSAQTAEELAEVAEQQVGGVVRGPVAAAVELAPGDDVGVVALGEPADRSEVEGEAS